MPGEITYSESELKTVLACSRLYNLGGSINNYDSSQKFLRYAFHKFILKVLKKDIDDIDQAINYCVNLAFNRFYSKDAFLQEQILKIKSYAFSFIHFFIENFSLKNFNIISGPVRGSLEYKDATITFGLDAIFNANKRKAQLHAICFLPYTDDHILSSDIGLRIKADYLRKFANSTFYSSKNSAVTLHIFSSYKFNYYKSKTKTFRYRYTQLQYEEVPPHNINEYIEVANRLRNVNFALPVCQHLKCYKRKECVTNNG